jgi:hypothetical protein
MKSRCLVDRDLRVNPLEPEYVSGEECDRVFGTTPDIRKNLRCSDEWYAPVHIVWFNSRHHVYRVSMVRSWLQNRHQSHVHLAEAEFFLQSLDQKRSDRQP